MIPQGPVSTGGRALRSVSWLASLLLLLPGPAAMAQLSGAYTINSALPTGGTNYASFTAAATALNTSGVSAPVTFAVSGGPYTEQLRLTQLAGSSATNRVTFNGNGRTLQFGSGNAAQQAVVTLDGADYVTIDSLVVDATVGGTSTAAYGWGVHLLNNADHCVISHCTVKTSTSAISNSFAGIVSGASATAATTTGPSASQDLTISNNTVTGGYYGIAVVGSGVATATTPGIIIRGNVIHDFYFYGIFTSYLDGPQLIANDIARPTRQTLTTFYGISLSSGVSGAAVEKNRIHNAFPLGITIQSGVFAMYMSTGTAATAASPNVISNNLLYNMGGNGMVYCFYNASSSYMHYYHNTIDVNDPASTTAASTYGLYQTSGQGVEFQNNLVQLTRGGLGGAYALYLTNAGSTISSHNNLMGSGSTFKTGNYSGTSYLTLADWQTANGGAFDQGSLAVDPQFLGVATGNLRPNAGAGATALNGAALPLARVTDDVTGAPRSLTAPDIGAYEFVPLADDVALLSIDAPAPVTTAGTQAVTATIRNNGATALSAVTLSYTLDGGAAVTQAFALSPALAANAQQQLTFTTGITLVQSGTYTLTVTGSLPNGQPDTNAANNSQTITITQPTPANDEPCGAVALGTALVASATSGATTSVQPGIAQFLPACSPAQLPRDVWFTATPPAGATALNLTLTGTPAGMVRVFSAPSCSAGPFVQVFCQSSGAANTSVGTVSVPGLVAGQTYYVAVSGYGSADALGPFTITSQAVLATRPNASEAAMAVFPNPSATGQLTLRVARLTGAGTATLLNALGQAVREQAISGAGEQQLITRGLAAGVYTLRVRAGGEVLTRKVVLQ